MRESFIYALRASEKQLKKNSVGRGKRSECGIPLGVLICPSREPRTKQVYMAESMQAIASPAQHAYLFAY
jgi:hypothetical protein